MVIVTRACLGVLVASISPVLHAGFDASISRETLAECAGVFRALSDKYDVKEESGTAFLLNQDYSGFERQGCVIIALGDYPADGKKLAPDQVIRHYFQENGWQVNINYLADGAGSGQNAYVKEAGDGRGTLCITQWVSDADLDTPPSFQSLRVTCVDNNERIKTGM